MTARGVHAASAASAPQATKSQRVPIEHLCVARLVPIEHVRALILAGRLAPPEVGPDGTEVVALDYLPPDPDPPPVRSAHWRKHVERELGRFRSTQARLLSSVGPDETRRRGLQLMRMGSNAWGAGLSLLMGGQQLASREWLDRAARYYRLSLAYAEPGSWGRSLAAIKARVLGSDQLGAVREARWTLELGSSAYEAPIPTYATCLAELVLDADDEAAGHAQRLVASDAFPSSAAAALLALATRDAKAYADSIAELLRTFETRDRYLESIPAADTVLVLQALAARRELAVPLRSPVLPTTPP